jgi:hypothetical protein
MSVVYQWPVAFVKHWILSISYAVGITYDGRTISPEQQFSTADFRGGRITFSAWFSDPVVAVYGFSTYAGRYTDPLVVVPDYPTLGVFLDISITP